MAACVLAILRNGARRCGPLTSNYKGFPSFVKQKSIEVNREVIDLEICLPSLQSLRESCLCLRGARHVDGETTNGHSRLLLVQRTLMKDARRGLHSLVEAQDIAVLLISLK